MSNQTKKPPMGGMGPRKGPMTMEKAKDFKGTTNKLIKNYLSKYKIAVVIVMIFAIGGTIFSIVGPKILGNATTEIYNGLISKLSGGEGINFQKIAEILLTLLTLYLISMVFSAVQGFTMTGVAQKITYKMRNELIEKINKLPMKYFDKKNKWRSIINNIKRCRYIISKFEPMCYANNNSYLHINRNINNDVFY